MVSFKNGVLKIQRGEENTARTIYEICFFVNTVTLFAFNDVKFIGTATGLMMLFSSMLLWIGRRAERVVVPYNMVWYALFTAYAALSGIWSVYLNTIMASYLLRMVVILAMLTSIAIYVDKRADLERLIKLYIFSVLVIVLLEFSSVPVSEWSDGSMGSHFSGSNPNGVAFIVWSAELMAFYEFHSKGNKKYALLVVLFLAFVILSSSRKMTFSALAGPILIVLFSVYKKNYLFNILIVVVLAVLTFSFIMTDENAYNAIGKRFASMFSFYFEGRSQTVDNSLYVRSYYIELAKRMFAESPLLGKGMGNFSKIINQVYMLEEAYSHNNFWQILSEFGLIGFVMYYSMYFVMLVRLAKGVFINKDSLSILFMTLMIMFLVIETGLVTYYSKMPQVVMAIAYTATYVSKENEQKYKYIEDNRMEESL